MHSNNDNNKYNNNLQRLGKGTGGIGNKRKNRDHPVCIIAEIGLNTEESPGDLKRLAVTQTPLKDHQLTVV